LTTLCYCASNDASYLKRNRSIKPPTAAHFQFAMPLRGSQYKNSMFKTGNMTIVAKAKPFVLNYAVADTSVGLIGFD
jgi:hypothetical protein